MKHANSRSAPSRSTSRPNLMDPSRRQVLKMLGGSAALAALPGSLGAQTPGGAAPRPNILLLVADDQQPGSLGALGHPIVKTPHLDQLVQRGTSFHCMYNMGSSSGPVCIPARAMLLTGRPLDQLAGKGFNIPQDHVQLPELLQTLGYTTFGCGKWHNDKASFQRAFQKGKHVFFGGMLDNQNEVPVHHVDSGRKLVSGGTISKNSTELFSDATVEFLEQHDGNTPFFCYAAFTSPHDPRTPPREYHDLYPPASVPVPDNFLPEHPVDIGVRDIRDEVIAPYPRTRDIVQAELAAYYGMISHLDAQIGRILGALEKSGRARDTIVIFTSDHGLSLGQHGLMGKQNVYEHSVGVPFVIAGPGIPGAQKTHALCYSFDLFPTLCAMLGTSPPESARGRSYHHLFGNPSDAHRDRLAFAYSGNQRAVRDRRFKLIEFTLPIQPATTLLFDLEADPLETRNLSQLPEMRDILEALRGNLSLGDARMDRTPA